jgi:hypothetical protein
MLLLRAYLKYQLADIEIYGVTIIRVSCMGILSTTERIISCKYSTCQIWDLNLARLVLHDE